MAKNGIYFKDSRFTLFPFQVMFSLCNLWLVAMQIKPYTDKEVF